MILKNTLAAGAALLMGLGAAHAKLVQFEVTGFSTSGETSANLSFVIDDEASFTGQTGPGGNTKLFNASEGIRELTLTVEDLSTGDSASIGLSDIAFNSGSLAQLISPPPIDFSQTLRLTGVNDSNLQIFSATLQTERDDPEYNPFSNTAASLLEGFDPDGFVLGALSSSSGLALNPTAAAAFTAFASILSADSAASATSLSFGFENVFATDDFDGEPVPVPAAALLFGPIVAGFAFRRRKGR
ncbi:MAG: hypothetical protein V2I43_01835 [Parvularcula sp.]|jgi:hypothetical protein|nr:hypothetical protein [Parvularcula sp.]